MMTLTEFLLARIADDEARARWGVQHFANANSQGEWIVRLCEHSLAECEAKRRVIDAAEACGEEESPTFGEFIRCFAAAHSGHSDYREEWKP